MHARLVDMPDRVNPAENLLRDLSACQTRRSILHPDGILAEDKLGRERSAFHQGPELEAHAKTGYICADQTVIFTFRLQQGGGPYIPHRRSIGSNLERRP